MSANSGRAKRSRNAWWPTRVGSRGWRSRTWGSNQGWKWSAKALALAGASQPWAKARTQAWAAWRPGVIGMIEFIAGSVGWNDRWSWRERCRGLTGPGRGPPCPGTVPAELAPVDADAPHGSPPHGWLAEARECPVVVLTAPRPAVLAMLASSWSSGRGGRSAEADQRRAMKTAVATSPPRAAPARVWAGVWSPSRTRDQATRATAGTVRVSAGPKVRARMATVPLAAAVWTDSFRHRVTTSAVARPVSIAATSATSGR